MDRAAEWPLAENLIPCWDGSKPTMANPTLAILIRPTLAKPTLAKPTLANVKVLVVCKDFWFFGVNCLGFLKLIVQDFLCVLS